MAISLLIMKDEGKYSTKETMVASFMGVNARMEVNPEWTEPAILWTAVAARKGEKRTKRLLSIVCVSNINFSFSE